MSEINQRFLIDQFLLKHYGFEQFTPGLERSYPLYAQLKNEFEARGVKVVTIAGTNGKGQTSYELSRLLKATGIVHTVWSSPHIFSITERFLSSEGLIELNTLWDLINECHRSLEIEHPNKKFSFYEFLFLVFLKWSAQFDALKVLVLEVGLGGRFDAVNHLDCDLAAITSISRDHQAILGPRYDLILYEKLGVARPHKKLFTHFKLDYLNQKTMEYTKEQRIKWQPLTIHLAKHLNQNISLEAPVDYFKANLVLARTLFDEMAFLLNLHLPTLMEKIDQSRPEIFKAREECWSYFKRVELHFIGAHNPDGMRETARRLQQNGLQFEGVICAFSKRDLADVTCMLKTLNYYKREKHLMTALYPTVFEHLKALDSKNLEDVLANFGHNIDQTIYDWKNILQTIMGQGRSLQDVGSENKKRWLFLGSYYFIGDVQHHLERFFPRDL